MTDGRLSGFRKNNYQWTYTLPAPATRWSLAASPLVWGDDGRRHYFVNDSNVVRYSSVQATPAGPNSPVIE